VLANICRLWRHSRRLGRRAGRRHRGRRPHRGYPLAAGEAAVVQ